MANHIYWILMLAGIGIIASMFLIIKLSESEGHQPLPNFDMEDRETALEAMAIKRMNDRINCEACASVAPPAFDFCRAPARDPKTGRFIKRQSA